MVAFLCAVNFEFVNLCENTKLLVETMHFLLRCKCVRSARSRSPVSSSSVEVLAIAVHQALRVRHGQL